MARYIYIATNDGQGTLILQGQSNEIFDLQFFSLFEPAWATDQWGKIVQSLIKISLSYSVFRVEKTDSPGYDTPGSKKKFTPRTFSKNEKFSLRI